LTNCVFEENRANGNGGGIRATFGASVKLVDCTFSLNVANVDNATRLVKNQDGGGAIAVQDASLEMVGGKIENNKASGFAGGGIYFISAAYDDKAEKLAEITHGTTFEKILKQGYGVTSAQLKLSNVIIAHNQAVGETCYSDTCTLSPRTGFKAGGAGGGIYALESLKDFKFPITVTLEHVRVFENGPGHEEDRQKADVVCRNLTKLVMTDTTINKHPSTKYAASLISVRDADLTASPQIVALRKGGEVYEESSSVKP
jgi:predicted outer membrane repeat protein